MSTSPKVTVSQTILSVIMGNEGITLAPLVAAVKAEHPGMLASDVQTALSKLETDKLVFRHGEPIVTLTGKLAYVGRTAGYFSAPEDKIRVATVKATPEQIEAAQLARKARMAYAASRANDRTVKTSAAAGSFSSKAAELLKARGFKG
jgi:hypothetical protein